MRWIIFVAVAAGILAIFGAVYGISYLVNRKSRPTYKSTAPDDDPKFLRDLAERLKQQDNENPDSTTDGGGPGDK